MSNIDKYQIKLRQEIGTRASFMNTTKWKALFSILKGINPPYRIKAKLLLDDTIRKMTVPDAEDFIQEKYLEAYWSVFELKEIEWLLIPAEIISERKNRKESLVPKITIQNLEVLQKALQTGKQFEYEVSSEGLKIYGYR